MKKITTVKDLLQLFVTEDEVFEIAMKYGYAETARKLDFLQLLHFWMISSTEKWESYRAAETELQNHPELPTVTYSTLAKKAKSVPYQIYRDLFQKLLHHTNRSFKRNFLKKYRLNVLDSTMITFTHPENQWARYSTHRFAIRLHTSFNVDDLQPLQVIETTGRDQDIMVAPYLMTTKQKPSIFTADRGYASSKFFDHLHEKKHFFVIRVSDFFSTSKVRTLNRHKTWGNLDPMTSILKDESAYIGKGQNRTKNRYRLVTFLDSEQNHIRVATNVRDVPPEVIAHVYKLRWQIELFFRWIKQNLEIDHLFGRSENAVYGQVFGTLIAYVLLRWLYNATESKWRMFASLNFLAFTRKFVYQTLPVEVRSEIQWFFLQGIGLPSKEEKNNLVNNV